MVDHTPTPWTAELLRWVPDSPVCGFAIRSEYTVDSLPDGFRMHSIASANLSETAAFTACFTPGEIKANAEFIVKAVNAYDDLVAMLTECRKQVSCVIDGEPTDWNAWLADLNAALAKVEA